MVLRDIFDIQSIPVLPRNRVESEIRGLCVSQYLGNHEILCRYLGRYKIFLDSRDVGFAPHIILDGFWEFWITNFMIRIVRPDFCVLDIGANFGYYSMLLCDLIGQSGRCEAVEPNPLVAAKLRKSLAINGFDGRAVVHEMALGRSDGGEESFLISDDEPKNGRVVAPGYVPNPDEGSVIAVPRMTVDSLTSGLSRLDFVKIDAEGAEADIIFGMSDTLTRFRPSLLIEFNMCRGYDGQSLAEQLQNIYGTLLYVDSDSEIKDLKMDTLLSTNIGQDWMLYFPR